MPNRSKPWGVAEKAEGVGGEDEGADAHGRRGPSGGEGPAGRGDKKTGGGGECQGIVGEGEEKILMNDSDGGSADKEGASDACDIAF